MTTDVVQADVADLIEEVDAFIAAEVRPLEAEGDNARFFDHRREHARTDWDNGGIPSAEWEALLEEMVARADRAGLWRYALPEELGPSIVYLASDASAFMTGSVLVIDGGYTLF